MTLPVPSGAADRPHDGTECRCDCGSLLARVCEGGIELKCRRCKRVVILPLASTAREPPPFTLFTRP